MRSKNVPYLPAVDHLRGFASILIVLYHSLLLISRSLAEGGKAPWIQAGLWPPGILVEGHTAVSLFMVLSGFIFTHAALGREIRYAGFLRNRVLRIYPLFITLILIGVAQQPRAFEFVPLLQTVLGFSNYRGGLDLGPISAMFWTIAIEVQFYLIFPFLLAMVNRDGPRALVRLCCGALAIRLFAVLVGAPILQVTYWSILGRVDQFLIGMLAAWFFASPRYAERPWRMALIPIALVVAVSLHAFNAVGGYPSAAEWKIVWPTIEGLLWGAFLLSYLASAKFLPGWLSTALTRVGVISYSTYLLHFTLIQLMIGKGWIIPFAQNPHTTAFMNGLLIALPLSLLLASITYAAIERPFLELRGRYLKEPGES